MAKTYLLLAATLFLTGCFGTTSTSTVPLPVNQGAGQPAEEGQPAGQGVGQPAAVPKQGSHTEQLADRIQDMIQILEAGDARESLRQLLPPKQFEEFLKEGNAEDELARFNERKVPPLLGMLKSLDISQATITGETATFEMDPRPVTFVKNNGKWYLQN